MGLIKNLKTKYNSRSSTCAVTVQVKMLTSKALQTGRDEDKVYFPRHSPTKWWSQMKFCYPIQLGVCHAQQWEIFFFTMKWLMGQSHQH